MPVSRQIQVWTQSPLTLEMRYNPVGAVSYLPPHSHTDYQLIVAEHSVSRYRYRRASHVAPADSLTILHPEEVHSAQGVADANPTLPLPTLFAAPSYLLDLAQQMGRKVAHPPFFTTPILSEPAVVHTFARLCRVLTANGSLLQQQETQLAAFALLLSRYQSQLVPHAPLKTRPASIRRVKAYLQEHYAETISLNALAEIAELSPYYLCRLFQQTVGLAPHAYQTQAKVAHAKTLLAQGRPPGDVAFEVGFADQSHLARHFKRLVGVSPGKYRAVR